MLKQILLYIWQLPQHIVALIFYLIVRNKKVYKRENGRIYISYSSPKFFPGASLGRYIFLINQLAVDENTNKHEYGHSRQSVMLGWLYLPFAGLLSAGGNLYDRYFHTRERGWSYAESYKWYYSQFIERWADKLGGVVREWEKENAPD